MNESVATILNKTKELEEELKNTGLWQRDMPEWVHGYDANNISNTNFAQWLQFVFVPNHMHTQKLISIAEKKLIVPHAIKYFGDDVRKGKLLKILIEIDSLL